MFFCPKSAVVYRISRSLDLTTLEEQLKTFVYEPCGPIDMTHTGWVSPMGEDFEMLLLESNGLILLKTMTESKIMPPSAIKEIVRQRVVKQEKEQHRRLKKKEISSINDTVIEEYLPHALSRYITTYLWIDPKSRLLVVECTSHKKAEDAAALLRKTIGSLPITPFMLEIPIELTLTNWVKTGQLPAGLTLCDEATLEAVLDEGGVVVTKRQDLVSDEIASHIDAGKLVTKVAMCWREHISFVVNDDFILSRINFADSLVAQNDDIDRDDIAQRFDADFVLFTGVLMEVIDMMIGALGGEAKKALEEDKEQTNTTPPAHIGQAKTESNDMA